MLCDLKLFSAFMRQLKDVSKKYPKSESEIDVAIGSLASNPLQGNAYPGFPFQVRKVRIQLREYRFGESKGLRLIFIYLKDKNIVAPLVIYKKGEIKSESEVKQLVKAKLKEVIDELSQR